MHSFEFRSHLPFPPDVVFGWHMQPGALHRLIPARDDVTVEKFDGIVEGGEAILNVKIGPVSRKWIAVHKDINPGESFTDIQQEGPFKHWEHQHIVIAQPDGTSEMLDTIDYRLPMESFLDSANFYLSSKLDSLFRYRHRILHNDLLLHDRYGSNRLSFAITGSSGLIGSELVPFLRSGGHTVLTLVRREPESESEIYWDPESGEIDADKLEGTDVIIHLAGAPLVRPWTDDYKRRILSSRVKGTKLIATTAANLLNKPAALISSSGIGIYGDRGDEWIYENADTGSSAFLAEVCREWERAADPARDAGIRTVHPRIGIVISGGGGALGRIVSQFKLGLGGVPGNPDAYLSWIAMDDLLGGLYHLSVTPFIEGPVNLSAPHPVKWEVMAKTLGRIMKRPSFWRLPRGLVKSIGGQFGDEVLLSSARVSPSVLEDTAYDFLFMILDDAIRHQLGY